MANTRKQDNPEELNEWGMPKMREPDFSDVRKRILAPKRIIIFLVITIVFWLIFYYFFPNTGPDISKLTEKQKPPAAAETQD